MISPGAERRSRKTIWLSGDWRLTCDVEEGSARLTLRSLQRATEASPTVTLGRVKLPIWIPNVTVNDREGIMFDLVSPTVEQAEVVAFAEELLPGQRFRIDHTSAVLRRELEVHVEVVEMEIVPAPVSWTAIRKHASGYPWARMGGVAADEQTAWAHADRALKVFATLLDSMRST